jgi:hypothetical protein
LLNCVVPSPEAVCETVFVSLIAGVVGVSLTVASSVGMFSAETKPFNESPPLVPDCPNSCPKDETDCSKRDEKPLPALPHDWLTDEVPAVLEDMCAATACTAMMSGSSRESTGCMFWKQVSGQRFVD